MRQMTPKGYTFLENEEGLRLYAYDDKTGRQVKVGDPVKGVLTIGWGHTGPDVFPGQTITREEAEALFDKDTDWAEEVVEKTMVGPNGERPNDNQFDACGSIAYNIGRAAYAGSSIVRNWKAGNWKAAGDSIALWNRDKFGVNDVLVARRAREQAIFFTVPPMMEGIPRPKPLMPQEVIAPAGPASSKTVWTTAAGATGAATIAASNVGPALDAINNAADTVEKAKTTTAKVGDLLAPLLNGHVYTVLILTVVMGLLIYGLVRLVAGIRAGRIKVQP